MSILRRPLDVIIIGDLEALVASEARETDELEFKGTLPFQPIKGQPQIVDRWIEKGDRIGNYARDEVLAELVAFANAEGGTVVLGLHETQEEPRRAERLEPLPNCEDLARRLIDASEDVIDPRLPVIGARALATDDTGAGYVLASRQIPCRTASAYNHARVLCPQGRASREDDCSRNQGPHTQPRPNGRSHRGNISREACSCARPVQRT
jgi:hypothetical protein